MMHFQSITSLLEEKKSCNTVFQNERRIVANALKMMTKKKYNQVILLLEPIYQKHNEKSKLSVLELLGFSYMEMRQYAAAFQVWKIIYIAERDKLDTKIKSYLKNIDHAGLIIKALTNMIACSKDATLTDHYVKLILDYIGDYLNEYSGTPELMEAYYVLYLNAGMKKNDDADNASDFHQQKRLTEEAKYYYEKALIYSKNDLTCLLYLARLLITRLQSPQAALEFLLKYDALFYNDPNYLFAIYKLYDALECRDLAEKYKKAYEKHVIPGRNDQKISIFAELLGPSRLVEPLSIDGAIIKFNNDQYDEARDILQQLLTLEPNNYNALELYARLEKLSGNIVEAMTFCDRVLKINPESPVGLIVKASCLWMLGSADQKKEAVICCERAYHAGARSKELFGMLMNFYHDHDDQKKFLMYALSYVNVTPSASLYYLIGIAHYRLGEFDLAKEAFIKARSSDNHFKNEETYLGVIYSMFMQANTVEQYKSCAEKIGSYLSCLGDRTPDSAVVAILKELNKLSIDVPNYKEITTKPESKIKEFKSNAQGAECILSPDVKEKIIEAMSKSSFAHDKRMKNPVHPVESEVKLEVKLDDLIPIGQHGNIKGFIDPNVNLTSEEGARCQQALASGRLLSPGSRGISGVKTSCKDPSKFKIKIIGRLRLWGMSRCVQGPDGKNMTVVIFNNIDRSHRKKG